MHQDALHVGAWSVSIQQARIRASMHSAHSQQILEKFEDEDVDWTVACRLQRALFEHKQKVVERCLNDYGFPYGEVQVPISAR